MSYATNTGFFVGDSIIDYGWADETESHLVSLENYATGAKGLVGGTAPNITNSWDTNWPLRLSTTDFVIIQGGINDIKNFGASSAQIEAAYQAIIDEAVADVGASRVFVWNIGPWKNFSSWSSAFQTITDSVNSYLATREGIDGFTLIDVYTLLEDPGNADELLPAYDFGDGLHPSEAGSQALRVITETAITSLLTLMERANTFKRWRGAVEPAAVGASGNEFKRWRGAVEPSATVVAAGGGDEFYIAVTRRTLKEPPRRATLPKSRPRLADAFKS